MRLQSQTAGGQAAAAPGAQGTSSGFNPQVTSQAPTVPTFQGPGHTLGTRNQPDRPPNGHPGAPGAEHHKIN